MFLKSLVFAFLTSIPLVLCCTFRNIAISKTYCTVLRVDVIHLYQLWKHGDFL